MATISKRSHKLVANDVSGNFLGHVSDNVFKDLCAGSKALENFYELLTVGKSLHIDLEVLLMLQIFMENYIEKKFCIASRSQQCAEKCCVYTYEVSIET